MVALKDAKEATDVIVRSARPVSVILFGSVAREGTGTLNAAIHRGGAEGPHWSYR